jgi:hypothetical protein
VELSFSPLAGETLDRLEKDASFDRLVDSIWDSLDLISESPDSAIARRRVLHTPTGHSVWLVQVPNRHNEDRPWIILWQPQNGVALVLYIGPDDYRF